MHEEKDETKRKLALQRAEELRGRVEDYLSIKDTIPNGLNPIYGRKKEAKKKQICSILNASEEEWNSWKWQFKNRICDVDLLAQIITLDDKEIENIRKVQQKFRWGISPYYASLIDDDDKLSPVKLQSIPSILELNEGGVLDPSAEEDTNPAGSITRRYPDRLIINVTNVCPSFCRHCQRRRNIGTVDSHKPISILQESIDYVRNNPEIRDVLITGGDALMLSDAVLDWLLGEIHCIPTVEYIRIGTRVPVTMPQRITENLLSIMKK
ncbi:MAG: radical SAM protein, partial [Bacillota bacterium]|nr:radical SAM protein [Bacillota bacterium]